MPRVCWQSVAIQGIDTTRGVVTVALRRGAIVSFNKTALDTSPLTVTLAFTFAGGLVVLVWGICSTEFVEGLVDAEQGFPRRVTRSDAELPPCRLWLLGSIDRRHSLRPPASFLEAELAVSRMGFETSCRLFLVGVGTCCERLFYHHGWWKWVFGTRLLSLHEVPVVRWKTAREDPDLACVRSGRATRNRRLV